MRLDVTTKGVSIDRKEKIFKDQTLRTSNIEKLERRGDANIRGRERAASEVREREKRVTKGAKCCQIR